MRCGSCGPQTHTVCRCAIRHSAVHYKCSTVLPLNLEKCRQTHNLAVTPAAAVTCSPVLCCDTALTLSFAAAAAAAAAAAVLWLLRCWQAEAEHSEYSWIRRTAIKVTPLLTCSYSLVLRQLYSS
jgi:hypothetical protein